MGLLKKAQKLTGEPSAEQDGADLPAKMLAGNDQAVVIDWPTATGGSA